MAPPLLFDPDARGHGLHLHLPDDTWVSVTPEWVEARSHAVLDDPSRLSPDIREAADFQLCSVCPKRGSGETCHAIRPIIAVFDRLDAYPSSAPVTAVYVPRQNGQDRQVNMAETTLQRALQYVSVLSLLYYCEVGRQYWRYFCGVHPLTPVEDVVMRVYLNMFWACGGDRERTRALATRFHDEITTTTRCQMARLRLICHSDALLNALILTQVASAFVVDRAEAMVGERLEEFDAGFYP